MKRVEISVSVSGFMRANLLMSYEIESDKFAEVLKHVRAWFLEVNTFIMLPLVQTLRRN